MTRHSATTQRHTAGRSTPRPIREAAAQDETPRREGGSLPPKGSPQREQSRAAGGPKPSPGTDRLPYPLSKIQDLLGRTRNMATWRLRNLESAATLSGQ